MERLPNLYHGAGLALISGSAGGCTPGSATVEAESGDVFSLSVSIGRDAPGQDAAGKGPGGYICRRHASGAWCGGSNAKDVRVGNGSDGAGWGINAGRRRPNSGEYTGGTAGGAAGPIGAIEAGDSVGGPVAGPVAGPVGGIVGCTVGNVCTTGVARRTRSRRPRGIAAAPVAAAAPVCTASRC